VTGRDIAFRVAIEDDDVVDTDCFHRSPVGVPVEGEEDDLLDSILGFDQSIPEGAPPPG
jgi:hypothetical protein